MPSFYDGKVLCPDGCCDGKIVVPRPEYKDPYEEQCWTCGGSGWVSEKWLKEHYSEEVVQRCRETTDRFWR